MPAILATVGNINRKTVIQASWGKKHGGIAEIQSQYIAQAGLELSM
jgi:hypothetical protein